MSIRVLVVFARNVISCYVVLNVSIFFVFSSRRLYASPGSVDGEYCGEVGDLVGASASDSPTLVGLYCGEVGEYCGDVGEYAGDVGEYAGEVGE